MIYFLLHFYVYGIRAYPTNGKPIFSDVIAICMNKDKMICTCNIYCLHTKIPIYVCKYVPFKNAVRNLRMQFIGCN